MQSPTSTAQVLRILDRGVKFDPPRQTKLVQSPRQTRVKGGGSWMEEMDQKMGGERQKVRKCHKGGKTGKKKSVTEAGVRQFW